MKQLVSFDPAFTPGLSGAGTLDFSGYPGFQLDHLYAVINTTRGTPIYVPGTTQFGITSASNYTITLAANTSTHSSNDMLLTFYDTAPGYESNFAAERNGQLQQLQETQEMMLAELRVITYVLQQGLNINNDDVQSVRNDMLTPSSGAV